MSGDSVSAVSLASNRVEPGSGLQCLHRARWPVHAAAAPDPGGSRSPAGPPLPARGHLRPDAPAPGECRPPSALRVPRGDSGAPAARAALPASPGCAARPPGPRPRRHLRRRSRRGPAAPQAGGRARRPWSGTARGPEPGRAGADGPRPSSPWRRRNRGGHRRARPTPGLRAQGGSRAGQGLSAPQRPRGLGTYPTGAPPAASPGGAHRICDPSRCGNRRTVGAPRPAGRDTVASAGGAPKGRQVPTERLATVLASGRKEEGAGREEGKEQEGGGGSGGHSLSLINHPADPPSPLCAGEWDVAAHKGAAAPLLCQARRSAAHASRPLRPGALPSPCSFCCGLQL